MLVKDIVQKTTQFFRNKGIETARLDTELLISSALHWERMKIYLNYEYPLSESELDACRELVKRRASGEPVAYILGKKDFYKHSFKVTPAVLIPRPETEQIVEEALEFLRDMEHPRIIDFGTGSGCIGLSIAAELPQASLLAIDISSAAIDIARQNAEALGLDSRVTFLTSDVAALEASELISMLGEKADVVVANPPYIAVDDVQVDPNVKRFEPEGALFSPDQGLAHIRAWSLKAAQVLRDGGMAMFEIGHEQGLAASQIFIGNPDFDEVKIIKDLAGRERFVRASRKAGSHG